MAWKPLVILLALASAWPVPAAVAASSPPGAPTGVTARAAVGCALVSWTPPASSGSSPITSYDVVSQSQQGVVLSVTSVPASQISAVVTGLPPFTQTFTVDAVNASGAGPASLPSAPVVPQAGGTYHPLAPVRILDTREGTSFGRPHGPLGPGDQLQIPPTAGGVPANHATAVILNVTVTDTTASSFLTIWPVDATRPLASSVNWTAGRTVANLVEVAELGDLNDVLNTGILIFNSQGFTDVVVDLEGYVGDGTNSTGRDGMFNVLQPARLLDTRNGHGPLGSGQRLDLQVAGSGGVPATGVSAVVLNLTATGPTTDSFLTVWPAGQAMPPTSNLNFAAGQTVPNRVVVKLGAGGAVSLYNLAGSVDVVVDVNGWFTDATSTAGGSGFEITLPNRLYDSRNYGVTLNGGQIFQIEYFLGPPTTAALAVNVTATDVTAPTFLTVYADGTPRPPTSDLNPTPGQVEANFTVTAVRDFPNEQMFDVFSASGSLDVVIDVSGIYTGPVSPLT